MPLNAERAPRTLATATAPRCVNAQPDGPSAGQPRLSSLGSVRCRRNRGSRPLFAGPASFAYGYRRFDVDSGSSGCRKRRTAAWSSVPASHRRQAIPTNAPATAESKTVAICAGPTVPDSTTSPNTRRTPPTTTVAMAGARILRTRGRSVADLERLSSDVKLNAPSAAI